MIRHFPWWNLRKYLLHFISYLNMISFLWGSFFPWWFLLQLGIVLVSIIALPLYSPTIKFAIDLPNKTSNISIISILSTLHRAYYQRKVYPFRWMFSRSIVSAKWQRLGLFYTWVVHVNLVNEPWILGCKISQQFPRIKKEFVLFVVRLDPNFEILYRPVLTNRTLDIANKIITIDLILLGIHIHPMPHVSYKFGKDIQGNKARVMILVNEAKIV